MDLLLHKLQKCVHEIRNVDYYYFYLRLVASSGVASFSPLFCLRALRSLDIDYGFLLLHK